jgi:hypothetical protein
MRKACFGGSSWSWRDTGTHRRPIAVSVVTGESMASLDCANAPICSTLVLSVKSAEGVHPRGEGFAIRGVGSSTFAEAVEGSVGVLVDGVVRGQHGAGMFDLADLAQVESCAVHRACCSARMPPPG